MPQSAIRIGTAGWSIPGPLRDQFAASGSQLEKYAARMNAVEINSSFYRPHRRTTYERWAAAVPADFRFAVKLPRSISHEQRLADFEAPLERFLEETSGLGTRLGVILVQLPPSLGFDADRAEGFFAALAAQSDSAIVCEPRHASWFSKEAEALLTRLGVARVAADPPRHPKDGVPGGARRFTYYRWHGAPKIYWSAYNEQRLAAMAAAIRKADGDVWGIFDNTAAGAALENALQLAAMMA